MGTFVKIVGYLFGIPFLLLFLVSFILTFHDEATEIPAVFATIFGILSVLCYLIIRFGRFLNRLESEEQEKIERMPEPQRQAYLHEKEIEKLRSKLRIEIRTKGEYEKEGDHSKATLHEANAKEIESKLRQLGA